MKDFVSFFLLLIVITIFYVYLETKSLDVKYIVSNVDNQEYLVRNLPDKQEASDLMANININLKKLIASVNKIERQEFVFFSFSLPSSFNINKNEQKSKRT